MHLMIEAYRGDPERLFGDEQLIVDYLYRMVELADMTPISEPLVCDTPEGGRTGFLVLAESHVSLCAVRELASAFIDLFTCKELSESAREKVEHYTKDYFGFEGFRSNLIERGLEYLEKEE